VAARSGYLVAVRFRVNRFFSFYFLQSGEAEKKKYKTPGGGEERRI
jgi:hypothetical protein